MKKFGAKAANDKTMAKTDNSQVKIVQFLLSRVINYQGYGLLSLQTAILLATFIFLISYNFLRLL